MEKTGGLYEIEQGSVDWDVYTDQYIDEDGNECDGDEYVKIDNIFVKHEFRGQGFARLLMTQAIEMIEKQYPGMEIKIVPEPKDDATDFTRLAAFYESLGLEVIAY